MSSIPQPTLLVAGVTHKTAHVELRERIAFRADFLPQALEALRKSAGCTEAVILSTCNRVEIYAAYDQAPQTSRIGDFLAEFHNLQSKDLTDALQFQTGLNAARHLFEVASSLDSLILGESEILAQTREAYRNAESNGSVGPVLRGLFERAFFLAKEMRGDGGLGKVQASVSSAAVTLSSKFFESLKGRTALVVGTGEMATGIVRALRQAGLKQLYVASRTIERAEEFAREEGGVACRMQDLTEKLKDTDIVLVSSAAPHYILTYDQVKEVQKLRRGRTLFMIDISVPRNVDPTVDQLSDVFLFNIDHLESVAEDGRRLREQIATQWRPRLDKEAQTFINELQTPVSGDIAKKLMQHAAKIRMAELENMLKALRDSGKDLDPHVLKEMEKALTRGMEKFQAQLLHAPLAALKEAVREGDGVAASHWASRLFKLQEEAESAKPAEASANPAPAQPTTAPTPEARPNRPDSRVSGAPILKTP